MPGKPLNLGRPLCRAALCLQFVLASGAAFGQTAEQNKTPAPPAVSIAPPAPYSDWHAFLSSAAKLNGLTDESLPPWHLKITYKTFDTQGKPTDQGIFEEYQASPTKFRVSFAGPSFSQSTYGTSRPDRAVFVTGGTGPSQPWPLIYLWGAFVSPLPKEEKLAAFDFQEQERVVQGNKISCLFAFTRATMATNFQPSAQASFCFDAGSTTLRSTLSPLGGNGTLMYRTNFLSFQGKTLPRDLAVGQGGKVVLSAHVEIIEAADKFDDALFVQPADARLYPTMPLPAGVLSSTGIPTGQAPTMTLPNPTPGALGGKIILPVGESEAHLLHRVNPVYPPIARAARISGTVVLQATIAKDGTIRDLHATSGPPMLLQAALDAVHQWTYQPFLVNGEPVEVETTVNVVFQLGVPPAPPSTPAPQP